LVDGSRDYAIFVLDADGTILTWNSGAEHLEGYTPEEVLGRHVSILYTDEDRATGKPDHQLSIAVADGHLEDEGWRIRKDGSRVWANVVISALRGPDNRLLGFGQVMRDLTERRRGEDALRDSEERFRLLVSGVADYAIFLLDPTGRVWSWNLGAERLKGYRADEIIGQEFTVFYTEEDRRAGVPVRALEHARREGRWESEGWRVRKDGTRFWASVVITRLIGHDGQLRGFAKVTRDLTERKRGEDALRGILAREREAAEQLRDLDRMRSDLVSTVAHDLRAPVGVMQSFLELLRDDWGSSTEAEKLELIERIEERVGTLASLVDDVFDLVRIDAGHLDVDAVAFDVNEVVDRAVVDLTATGAQTLPVDVDAQPGVEAIGDARRTLQVVTNLLSNALKFGRAGSVVRVGVHQEGTSVIVAVTDEGPGIADEDLGEIFARFSRLPGAAGTPGSGLGLFIARWLAAAQHGEIQVDSVPGQGSTFRLVLPAAPTPAA
jgi:PAS domain S-box-containing protein